MPNDPEIQRLIRLSQASRSILESEVVTLKHRLDFPSRLRGSLRKHPSTWLFGSLASGFAASLVFRRPSLAPSKPKKMRMISSGLLGLILTAARPALKLWLSDQLKQWLAGISDSARQSSSRTNFQNSPSPPHVQSSGPGPR